MQMRLISKEIQSPPVFSNSFLKTLIRRFPTACIVEIFNTDGIRGIIY